MKLDLASLKDRAAWDAAGVKLPEFDIPAVIENTKATPTWVHFGAGNIFRGYVANLQNDLLNKGLASTGIIAVDSSDGDQLVKVYRPFDNLTYANTNAILAAVGEDVRIKGVKRYGMKINKNDSNPATRCTYLFDAVGMTPAAMNYSAGRFDFGDWGDVFFVKNNYPAMVRYDGTEDYKLDPNDHTKKADGTIVGSTLTLDNAIKNLMRFCDITFEEALICATKAPAEMVGIYDSCGSVEIGKRADILVLDKEKNISSVIVGGKKII